MQTYKEIIDKNIKEFDEKFVVECPTGLHKGKMVLNPIYPKPILFWHTQSLISYLEEENKRLEEEIDTIRNEIESFEDDWRPGRIRSKKGQVEHNKNVIAYLKQQ